MNGLESFKQKLANREKMHSTMLCHVGYTGLPAVYKRGGLDFLVMDLEHGSFNPENIGDFVQACRNVDLPVIVRIQDCEYHCISKPIDMGVDGILVPRTETMEQVETAIHSMRVYPKGKKGVGGRALLRPGEDIYDINTNRLLFIQIESKQGVDLLDEMLTKYGEDIAGIIIGPTDMATSLGCGLDTNAAPVIENVTKTIEICQKHKKSIGMYMGDDQVAKYWYEKGMNIFWVCTEMDILFAELDRTHKSIEQF